MVKYTYQTQLKWTSERKGVLSSKDKPDIMVATPPEFGGHEGIWTPEDLFLASVEICILTTFLWFVKKHNINLKSYDSKAIGTVELIEGAYKFSKINIKLKLGVFSENDRVAVEKVLKKVKRACLISNSIQTDVNIESEIFINCSF